MGVQKYRVLFYDQIWREKYPKNIVGKFYLHAGEQIVSFLWFYPFKTFPMVSNFFGLLFLSFHKVSSQHEIRFVDTPYGMFSEFFWMEGESVICTFWKS